MCSETLQRWFCTQECALMRYRMELLAQGQGLPEFVQRNGLPGERISSDEVDAVIDQLRELGTIDRAADRNYVLESVFRVPWMEGAWGARACGGVCGMAAAPISLSCPVVSEQCWTRSARRMWC